ncbi:methyltransferase domain-containing protein [Gammaproteobacteria bacterium]|nr:methyltransferase domain-containing protein [Gammaproteobacteria bacterium]
MVSKDFEKLYDDWRKIGEEEPCWGVCTNELFLPNNIDDNIEKFYAKGRKDVQTLRKIARKVDFSFEGKRVLDFGCGVGRLTFAMAPYAASVVGVDISEGQLKEARKNCTYGNVDFIQSSDDLTKLDMDIFDGIISLLTLQHNRPPLIRRILEQLLQLLKPGGHAFLQIHTDVPNRDFEEILEAMEMHYLPGAEVEKIGSENDCILKAAIPRGKRESITSFIFVFCRNGENSVLLSKG